MLLRRSTGFQASSNVKLTPTFRGFLSKAGLATCHNKLYSNGRLKTTCINRELELRLCTLKTVYNKSTACYQATGVDDTRQMHLFFLLRTILKEHGPEIGWKIKNNPEAVPV